MKPLCTNGRGILKTYFSHFGGVDHHILGGEKESLDVQELTQPTPHPSKPTIPTSKKSISYSITDK